MKDAKEGRLLRLPVSICLLSSGLSLLTALPARGQSAANNRSEHARASAAKPSAPEQEKKPVLAEIPRVSTAEAARDAARDQAKPEDEAVKAPPEDSAGPAVTEFKPAAKSSEASGDTAVVHDSKNSKPLKVHGRIHGSLDSTNSGDHQEGGAVGVGSKGGKTNIYVETERSRRTLPPTR